MTSKAQATGAKISEWDYDKLKTAFQPFEFIWFRGYAEILVYFLESY